MFELLKPDKEKVGNRLKEIKDELGVSFTEYGNRLGLKKPTISSYVQGYTLAPREVIEKVSKISGKAVGWFYFGELRDYIRDYLLLKGEHELLNDYPDFPVEMEEELLDIKNNPEITEIKGNRQITTWRNPDWENDFGYPAEDYLDDLYWEQYHSFMKEYLKQKTNEAIEKSGEQTETEREELYAHIFSNVWGYFSEVDSVDYSKREILLSIINSCLEDWEKRKEENKNEFYDEYLVGKLINLLKTKEGTKEIIYLLSQELTGHHFSTFWGGDELIDIFQSMRSDLIELYAETSDDEFYEWFAK